MAISQTIGQLIGPTLQDTDYAIPFTTTNELADLDRDTFSGYRQYSINVPNLSPGSRGMTYYFDQISFPRDESIAIDYLVFLSQKESLSNTESNYIQIQDVYAAPGVAYNAQNEKITSYVKTSFGTTITAGGYQYIVIVVKCNSMGKEIPERLQLQYDLQNNIKKINIDNLLIGSKWKKIGIQADPGFVYFINGEPIMVGRSGFSETPDDYSISAVGFLNRNFVCDYYIDTNI